MKFLKQFVPHRLTSLLLALAVAAVPAVHAAPQASKHPKKTAAAKKAGSKKAATKASKSKGAKTAKAKPAPVRRGVDYVGEQVNFGEWSAVQAFTAEMVAKHGFDRAWLDGVIRQVHFVDSAVQLVKPAPPGKPKNWQAVRELFIEPVRVNGGVRFWDENADALARAEQRYGVPADIIVGIIGVETVYGRNTGRFRVLDTLTTLAFAYPETPNRAARMTFFRSELENALVLARHANFDPLTLTGSFAGAVGMPQFMPGSILAHAVDFDGNGAVDLLGSSADAIGSVANFLANHGWQRSDTGPLAYPVDVSPAQAWKVFINQGLEAKFRQEDLLAAGVLSRGQLPPGALFGLVDLQNGAEPTEYWLATGNFFAITKYNRSYFYAMSVIELGRAVQAARTALANR
ncbi:lytic murein transglycosylase B [Massilia cavernae]|uniref:Lytic murein transglycosylase B n=1 Tax=Massilia cavernae TaxID=2320864 RepID=A0A418Y6K7_9BURK|nr:lytic murein transglycosylase B [Massilia cavernae]RJG23911.1 lytic murein transglycosylase B [Massilia cavernae]